MCGLKYLWLIGVETITQTKSKLSGELAGRGNLSRGTDRLPTYDVHKREQDLLEPFRNVIAVVETWSCV